MTLEEYAVEVAAALVKAYNDKDRRLINTEFHNADTTLDNSEISKTSRDWFWSKVKTDFKSSRLRFEKQDNSSLIALMQAIEQALATRGGK